VQSTFSKKLELFRLLFPSWRFYSEVTEVPVLFYRLPDESDIWKLAINKSKQHWHSLFFNPEGNLYHAITSLLQKAEQEIGELEDPQIITFENSVSFNLIKNLVEYQLRKLNHSSVNYQFKVSRVLQGESNPSEDFLISRIYRL
jgi:hypothetical protein